MASQASGGSLLASIVRQLATHAAKVECGAAKAGVQRGDSILLCAQSANQARHAANFAAAACSRPCSSGNAATPLAGRRYAALLPGHGFACSVPQPRQLHQAALAVRRAFVSPHAMCDGQRQLTLLLRQQRLASSGQQAASVWRKAAARIAWQRLQELEQLKPRTWFLDRILRPSVNAVYTAGGHVQRLLPLMVAELARRDKFAACLAGPSVYDHRLSEPEWHHNVVVSALITLATLVENAVRLLVLSVLFTPLISTAYFALEHDVFRPQWLSLLRKTLELAGPAFMKWGQWAATRADIFPPDMCTELARLQTSAPAHSAKRTRHTVKSALGAPVEDLFSRFDDQPVASGSIGQIHRAVLSERGALHTGVPAGTQVAVKVRHPGVGNAIARDFALMMATAKLAECFPSMKRLRLQDSLRQFAAPLREQVDLAQEGRHLWQFNYNFRKDPHIRFPFPIYPLVSPEVLVETFEVGEHITKYVELGPGAPHNADLAALGSGAMLQMMLVDNLIHADLHPGNILVHLDPPRGTRRLYERIAEHIGLKTPEVWNRPAIVLLDVGMATHLTDAERLNMVQLFKAFTKLDGAAMAQVALGFSAAEQSCPDPEAFQRDCAQLFSKMREAHEWGSMQYENGAEAMAATLELIRKHEVTLPGQVCAVLVTTLVLEGWSSKLAPEHSVINQVEQLILSEEIARRTLPQRLRSWLDLVVQAREPLPVKIASPY